MSRLTLRLPDSLHQQLHKRADAEGVSLNQFIVYLLTRTTTVADIEEQRQKFDELLIRHSEEEAGETSRHAYAARAAEA